MKCSKRLPATCEQLERKRAELLWQNYIKVPKQRCWETENTIFIMENFILYEELGTGSRSVVYKGRRKGTLNYVAIVCAEKSKRPEITNHVRLSHDLSHGNIVSFYEWYETSNHLWLVTELCTGGSLEGVIGQDGCLSEEVVKEFGRDLVRGLRHIHQSGIIFSELTPAKILLDGPGVLKFSNFCQSKAEGETLEEFFSLLNTSEQTGGGRRGGTDQKKNPDMNDRRKRIQGCPLYTAPEVLKGAETSCSSDLWALGCVLYYMYTGKPPFYSDSYTELTDMILHKEPPPARQTGSSSPPSEEFQRLLEGLLIKDPDKRMGWPELLTQPYWTQILEEEDEESDEEGSDVSDDSINVGYGHRHHKATEAALPKTDRTSTCTHPSVRAEKGDRTRPPGVEQNSHTLYHKSFTLDSMSELKPKHVDKDNTEAFFLRSHTSPGRKSNGPDNDSNNF